MSLVTRLRRFWLDVHLWLGAALALPIIAICLSGAVLTFHDELERMAYPQRFGHAEMRAPAADYVEAARAAIGEDFVVTGLRLPAHAGDAVAVPARAKGRPPEGQRPQTRTVFLDPADARVIEVANPRGDFFGVMHVLHGSLMVPGVGRKIVGWIGWAMTISTLTGIWLWWPRNGAFLQGLRWRRGPRTTFNLHHMTGFWIAIPLLILSLTGVYISFPQSARAFAQNFVAMSPQEARGPGGGGGGPGGGGQPMARTHTSIDGAIAAARAAQPNAQLVAINIPTRTRDGGPAMWRADLRGPGGERLQVQIDDATGAARAREERPSLPGDGLALTMRRIHDGVDQHIAWRIVVFLGGVIPALLAVTGIVMWLRRRAARRAVKRGHPGGAGAADAQSEGAAARRT